MGAPHPRRRRRRHCATEKETKQHRAYRFIERSGCSGARCGGIFPIAVYSRTEDMDSRGNLFSLQEERGAYLCGIGIRGNNGRQATRRGV